jgi:protein O-mannosyl-transferase
VIESNEATSTSKKKLAFLACALWLMVFLFFIRVGEFEFINFDDTAYVTENQHVRQGLTYEGLVWAFTASHGGHWHPLSWISHMVDVQVFGMDAGAHHLVNVFFHALNVALLFLFVTRLSLFSLFGSFILVLLFAFHPMRLESVAWVSERKDVLSMFFMLLSLHAYLSYTQKEKFSAFLQTFCLLVLGLLAKPSAVVLPALYFLLDWYPLRRKSVSIKKIFLEKIPFCLAVLGCCLAAVLSQQSGGGLKSLVDYPADLRIATVFTGYSIYLGKFFFPTGQGIFYPYQIYQPGVASGSILLLIGVSLICFKYIHEKPYLLFGWLWFLVSLLPVIGIVQIGGQSYADRWSYLPHIGLLIGTMAAWEHLAIPHQYQKILAIFTVFALSFLTYRELPFWKTSESIFRHTLTVTPENFMAEMNLGVALQARGSEIEAGEHLERAVLLRPFYPDALTNLAISKYKTGRVDEAESLFRRAVTVSPQSAMLRYNLMQLLLLKGAPGAALEEGVIGLEKFLYSSESAQIRNQVEWLVALPCEQFETSWNPSYGLRRILERWPVPKFDALRRSLDAVLRCRS